MLEDVVRGPHSGFWATVLKSCSTGIYLLLDPEASIDSSGYIILSAVREAGSKILFLHSRKSTEFDPLRQSARTISFFGGRGTARSIYAANWVDVKDRRLCPVQPLESAIARWHSNGESPDLVEFQQGLQLRICWLECQFVIDHAICRLD